MARAATTSDVFNAVADVETVELREEDGVTTMTDRLAFKDQATRDSMTWVMADGVHADEGGQVSWDRLEDHLSTLA